MGNLWHHFQFKRLYLVVIKKLLTDAQADSIPMSTIILRNSELVHHPLILYNLKRSQML